MPSIIDPLTMYVDNLPGIWSPVQWEISDSERIREIEDQAVASLLWAVDAPESILRLLLNETDIQRISAPPEGYDPKTQGEWDETLVTFKFKRSVRLVEEDRGKDNLLVSYEVDDLGLWALDIGPEKVVIERI